MLRELAKKIRGEGFHQHRPRVPAPNPSGKRERLGVGIWGLNFSETNIFSIKKIKKKNTPPGYFDTHVLSIWKFCERSAANDEVGEDSSRVSISKQPVLSNLDPKPSLGPNNVLPEGFRLADQGEWDANGCIAIGDDASTSILSTRGST